MAACGGTHLADALRCFQRAFQGTFRPGDDSPAVTRTYQSAGTRRLRASCYQKPGKQPKPTATAILTALWPWWLSCLQNGCLLLQQNGTCYQRHIAELNWRCSGCEGIFITFVLHYYYYYYYYYHYHYYYHNYHHHHHLYARYLQLCVWNNPYF